MAKLFESIGKGIGGVFDFAGDVVGGLAQGASDVAGLVPAIAESRQRVSTSKQQMQGRKIEMLNNAAGMLFNTKPEDQDSIVEAFKRIGFDDNDISAVQQIAASGQPLSAEEAGQLFGEGVQEFGSRGEFLGARTGATTGAKTTAPGTIPRPTVQSRRFDEAVATAESELKAAQKDGKADLVKKQQKILGDARLARDRFLASQTGVIEEQTTETIPAVTRPANVFESILPGGVKRGGRATVTPATTRTTTQFVAPQANIITDTATPDTAPSLDRPKKQKAPVIKAPSATSTKEWRKLDPRVQEFIDAKIKAQPNQKARAAFIKQVTRDLNSRKADAINQEVLASIGG